MCVCACSLVFYPTSDPSHRPINRVELCERAVCLEFVRAAAGPEGEGEGGRGQKPRVFIGHAHSMISIYHMDECES